MQGEIDHQDAQDTDSMALQTMSQEATESFKADKLECLWKSLKMLKAGCQAQKKKIGEEGKVRKFKKLLANLMTAALCYCNEFKHKIQGYSRELKPYNAKGMTMSLEKSFNSLADKFCDAIHTALPLQWWDVAYMPMELDLYNKETAEDIRRRIYCHVL